MNTESKYKQWSLRYSYDEPNGAHTVDYTVSISTKEEMNSHVKDLRRSFEGQGYTNINIEYKEV